MFAHTRPLLCDVSTRGDDTPTSAATEFFFLIIRFFITNLESSARNLRISKLGRGRRDPCRSARAVPKSYCRRDPHRRMHAASARRPGPHLSALLVPIGTARADLCRVMSPRRLPFLSPFFLPSHPRAVSSVVPPPRKLCQILPK